MNKACETPDILKEGQTCNRCWREWMNSDSERDEDDAFIPCRHCGRNHLPANMSEKIDGYYCETCAPEYERKLLKRMSHA